jgi:3-oxoacyl-[acyl-carrier protein] reductase
MPHLVLLGPGGIGSAIARHQAAAGWSVSVLGRNAQAVAALAAELPDADSAVCDPTDPDGLQAVAPALRERRPAGIAAVVCAVGSFALAPAHRTTGAAWRAMLAANLDAAFAAVRLGVELMPTGGSVLVFSSCAARLGLPNHEAVAAAKAGVEGLVRAAAATYAKRNLRINAIAPGLTDTPLAAPILAVPAARAASVALHPLGRIGSPAQVARLAAALIDPANDQITGSILAVDGGLGQCRG